MLKKTVFLIAIFTVLGAMLAGPALSSDEDETAAQLEQGKAIAFNRMKGNCLACHFIEGGELAGNYGPPLVAMKLRYPDREVLRSQIWDAAVKNPNTRMPPFGRNRILTEEEIDLVTDYIQSL
jgi:L-cysteine S-thiosulfotransferase